MKYAVIADIHANWKPSKVVLETAVARSARITAAWATSLLQRQSQECLDMVRDRECHA